MHARVTTIQGQPDQIDQSVDQVRSDVLSVLTQQQGFKGFSLLVDRSSGKLVGVSYWESEDALNASEEAIRTAREQVAETVGAPAPSVERFEVAIDTEA